MDHNLDVPKYLITVGYDNAIWPHAVRLDRDQ